MENISEMFGKKGGNADIPALLFKSQVEAHITHLLQPDKTLARHEALSIYYESIDGIMDTFIETYMGMHDIKDICVEKCCVIKEPIKYFEDLYAQIEKLRRPIKETFLQNQIDEAQQLIAHTLYRLKNIIT